MPLGDHRLPEQPCPHCGYLLDGAGNFDGSTAPPEPDDATVCIGCAALLRFDANMQLREFTAEQLEALPTDFLMDLMKVRAMVVRVLQDHQPPQGGA